MSVKKVSVIRCECGFEIPLVPNVSLVGNAIDVHVEEHRKQQVDPVEAENVARHIELLLFTQLFEKIIKMAQEEQRSNLHL